MAVSYRVSRISDGHPLAMKILFVRDPSFQERLRRSGELQNQLNHPNLMHVDETIDVDGMPALVMDFVDGSNLGAWLAQGPHPLGEMLWLFRGIVEGTAAAQRSEPLDPSGLGGSGPTFDSTRRSRDGLSGRSR